MHDRRGLPSAGAVEPCRRTLPSVSSNGVRSYFIIINGHMAHLQVQKVGLLHLNKSGWYLVTGVAECVKELCWCPGYPPA
jgi:hypothetical protein